MKKKTLALLLCAVLMLSILPMAGGAMADTYLDASGEEQDIPTDAVALTNQTSWGTGWYMADGTVSLGRVTVSGDVNLILKDGCALTTGTIEVSGTNKLTIYAQSTGEDMGVLTAQAGSDEEPGIGNDWYDGVITINGGKIMATGGYYGAGIGGGKDDDGCIVTINGGDVKAIGGLCGAGIGGGLAGDGGTTTINGGVVYAKGGDYGAGIGGGQEETIMPIDPMDPMMGGPMEVGGMGGTTTINGGDVTAIGGTYGAGIGAGMYGNGGGTTNINGGTIHLTSSNAPLIGCDDYGYYYGAVTLGDRVRVYDEDDQRIANDSLTEQVKASGTLSFKILPPGPGVSVTTDVTAGTVKYPGETFTVTVAAEGVANYAGFLKLTYNTADVALTDSRFIDGAETNTDTAGSVTMLIMGITEAAPTLAELTFTVQEITADKTTDVVVAQADFTPIDNMDADAIAADLDPEGGKVSVSLCAGYPVSFVASYGAASAISAQTIVPNGNATVPDSTDDVTVPDGKVFMGWADVTDGDNDTVVLAPDATTVAVTGPVTYKAVFELDITITQDINYIGGYVRIVVKDNQSAFKGFDFTFGSATNTMYKLDTDTYAYMYKPERDGNNKLAPIDLGQDTDTPAQKAAKLTAAKALFAALTAAPDSKYDLSNPTDANDVNGTGVFDIADVRATFNCANASTVTGVAFDSYVATCLRADLNKDGVVDADDQTAIVNTALGIKTETPSMEG